MFWIVITVLWLGSFAFFYALGYLWAPLIVLIPLGTALGFFVFSWRQQRATAEGGEGLGAFSFFMHLAGPMLLIFLAYQLYAGMAPHQRVVLIEKTQTLIVTDHSQDALIAQKYVADDFFRYFLVVLLIGAVAQGLYLLARGYVPAEVALLIISVIVALVLFLPKYSQLDTASVEAFNTLFLWGALATTIWSLLTTGVSFVGGFLQQGADRAHSWLGLAALIILAPVGILIALSPETLVMAGVTRLVHETSLTMDQALITLQQGALFGVFGPGALRELIQIVKDLIDGAEPTAESELEGEE